MFNVQIRINSRCTDLVEVIERDHFRPLGLDFATMKVDFLHRTVRDFLKTRELHDVLTSRLTSGFDVFSTLGLALSLVAYQFNIMQQIWQPSSINDNLDKAFETSRSIFVDSAVFYAREGSQLTQKLDKQALAVMGARVEAMGINFNSLAASWGFT